MFCCFQAEIVDEVVQEEDSTMSAEERREFVENLDIGDEPEAVTQQAEVETRKSVLNEDLMRTFLHMYVFRT